MAGAGAKAARVIEDGAILIEKDVIVPLIDGHYVSCNVFRPNRTGRFPPIIAFTPYGKDSDVAVDFKRYWDFVLRDHPDVVQGESSGKYLTWEVPDPERWVPAGYAIVVVDARGTGKSPGYYELMGALQTRDVYDAMFCTSSPIPVKTALNLLGHDVGGFRLPLVEADESELATVRATLERHGLLTGAHAA